MTTASCTHNANVEYGWRTWVEKKNVFKADVFIQVEAQFTDPSNQFRQSVLEA